MKHLKAVDGIKKLFQIKEKACAYFYRFWLRAFAVAVSGYGDITWNFVAWPHPSIHPSIHIGMSVDGGDIRSYDRNNILIGRKYFQFSFHGGRLVSTCLVFWSSLPVHMIKALLIR